MVFFVDDINVYIRSPRDSIEPVRLHSKNARYKINIQNLIAFS